MLQAIGLMSGTSLDGVDVAAISTDGERIAAFGPRGYRPYAEAERALLRQALSDAALLSDRTARPGALAAADRLVTAVHGEAVADFLAAHPIRADIIGFHGQTVLHRPERGLTVQIGAGDALARLTGIPVAYDFRAADVAAGGQGAPLVPVFHRALAAGLDRPGPLMVLNIGGVANISYLAQGNGLRGTDRLRHRAGQRPDRRFRPRAHRRGVRRGRRNGGGGHRRSRLAGARFGRHRFLRCRRRNP